MDHRGDVEEHTWQTHRVELSEIELEATIQVNEGEALILSEALNFKELSIEGRRQIFDSWFDTLAANGTVTRVESRENAKIQRHKAGNFLKALKPAIGNDFFQKVYYQLTRQLKENDLYLGFTCRWSVFTTATEDALGPLADVKRLKNFLSTKEHLRGGISLADALYKCSHIVDEIFGKVDITTKQEDSIERSNKPTKEFQKFLLGFEVVEALPAEYDKVREDLEISISSYIFKPKKFFDKWTEEADTNATTKGHTVMFKDKILPPLAQTKSFRNNTTSVITDEARKKFREQWDKIIINTEEDDIRRGKILKIVEPLMTSDPRKPVIDVPEVKNLVGETRICWGCLSQTCRARQSLSQKLVGKKLVNKFCPLKRVLIGDKNLSRSLKGKVGKNNYVVANEESGPRKPFNKFNKFNKGQGNQKPVWTTSLVQRPTDPVPAQEIVRANFTGLTDEDLFGPAFLYEEPEMFVEKKVLSTNPIQRRYGYASNENYYSVLENEDDEEKPITECFDCGRKFPYDEDCPECENSEPMEETNYEHSLEQSVTITECFDCGTKIPIRCGLSKL